MVGIFPLWGSRSPGGGKDDINHMIIELMMTKTIFTLKNGYMKVGAEIPGLSCLVEGTIPPSAGLSSSSGVVMIICFSIEMDKSQVLYLDDFMILAKKWWTWAFAK